MYLKIYGNLNLCFYDKKSNNSEVIQYLKQQYFMIVVTIILWIFSNIGASTINLSQRTPMKISLDKSFEWAT